MVSFGVRIRYGYDIISELEERHRTSTEDRSNVKFIILEFRRQYQTFLQGASQAFDGNPRSRTVILERYRSPSRSTQDLVWQPLLTPTQRTTQPTASGRPEERLRRAAQYCSNCKRPNVHTALHYEQIYILVRRIW